MIHLNNVTKIYKKNGIETMALDHVSLDIDQGEMLAIMGPSGSGKSTLLNIIGAMDKLTEGTYMFDDINVGALSGRECHHFRKEHIAFIFQNFELMPRYTVYENVEMPLKVRNVKGKREIILKVLEQVGLQKEMNKKIEYLSGGQQQRCAIARAIVMDTDIILADEPTGSLDQKTGQEVISLLKDINHLGKTVVIVTHDAEIAAQSNRIITIHDGVVGDNLMAL